eukprot:10429249-Karenia_brevis.AAC.1
MVVKSVECVVAKPKARSFVAQNERTQFYTCLNEVAEFDVAWSNVGGQRSGEQYGSHSTCPTKYEGERYGSPRTNLNGGMGIFGGGGFDRRRRWHR